MNQLRETRLDDAVEKRPPDRLFAVPHPQVADFDFGPRTAAVFEDMLERSVPFYREIQRMILDLASDFAVDGTRIYDLGCSTGTTLVGLGEVPREITLIGIDNSQAMLDRAAAELSHCPRPFELLQRDLQADLGLENASVVVLSLTLQFVRPPDRQRLLAQVYEGLNRGGCAILIEKVLSPDSCLNRLLIKYYYDFKRRNGYSDMEISQKREALENVLIPYYLDENLELLRAVGFRATEVFFKWNNFTGVVAVKR